MGDFARAAILPSLVAILVSLGGMDQQNNPGGDPSGQPPRHPPWTYEEIAERSAEVWEDNHWPSSWCSSHSGWDEVEQPAPVVTQPTQEQESSSSCSPLVTLPSQLPVEVSSSPQQLPLVEPTSAWDADISLSLQEQELEAWLHDPSAANLAPIPEDVPPPFGFTRWGVMSSQSSSTPQQEGPGVFAQSAASSSTSATCGASSSHSSGHDSFTLGGVDKASSSCESPPPFDVTTKEDVDPIAALRDLRPLRGRAPPAHNGHADAPRPPHGRDPSSLATPKACEMGTGITQRGSRLRSGIDRWHHPDGSIRYRLREQQALQETATLAQRTNLDQHPANDENPPHENANQNFSFYKDREWCQQGEPAPAQGKPSQETLLGPANQSTTADSSGNVGGDHHGSSVASSISSCSEVGFWKQGIWQPRQRTPAEARCHRGGGGPQRTLRKQARIQSYLQGTWKPAWLQRYIAEKDERTKNLVAETVNSGEESGIPPQALQRIEDLLQSLEDHQSAENGPESRWALGRLCQRIDEALDSMQSALNVVMRRLQPRGVWPVVRVPRAEIDQLRLFNWVCRHSDIFSQTLEHHVSTPLQPTEFPARGVTVQVEHQSTRVPRSSSARDFVKCGGNKCPDCVLLVQFFVFFPLGGRLNRANGSSSIRDPLLPPLDVALALAETGTTRRALEGELLGVWAEPEEEPSTATQSQLPALASESPSSTSTSTWSWFMAAENWLASSTSTSTTSSSSSTIVDPVDVVRDVVYREMVFANAGDLVDLVHRLLARMRVLLRNQRLLQEAVEEVLLWFPAPPGSAALNSPTMEMNIWRSVATNAASSQGGSGLPAASSSEAVLLQPGLPSSVEEAHAALPSLEPRVVASLRRRLWQRHMAVLHAREGEDIPRSIRPLPETNLYLIQTDENVGVTVAPGNPPARAAPVRGEVHSRRRLRHPRRVPTAVGDLVGVPAPEVTADPLSSTTVDDLTVNTAAGTEANSGGTDFGETPALSSLGSSLSVLQSGVDWRG
ncbi:unnamed protein product, partial [Symbiodinium microadriaticum]